MTKILIDKETVGLAFEALEDLGMKHYERTDEILYKELFTVLRQALEQSTEQEPVAWVNKERNTITWDKLYTDMDALYTQPQEAAPRQWAGLTEKERLDLAVDLGAMSADWIPFMEAVEARLKEKNT